MAAIFGHINNFKLLIERGADINILDNVTIVCARVEVDSFRISDRVCTTLPKVVAIDPSLFDS